MSDFFGGAQNTNASHSNFNSVGRDQTNINTTNTTYITNVDHADVEEIEKLRTTLWPVECGGDIPICLEGTREDIFKRVDDWLDDFDASNILWISGCPGAGKSTVASSLVSRLWRRARLASKFFFKREDVARSDPATLWRTVAFYLAQFDPAVARAIAAKLKNRGDFPKTDIQLHFEELIKGPLTDNYDTNHEGRPVVVLDALDECGCESQSTQRRTLLETLSSWSCLPSTVKLIVTGRNDRVPQSFRDVCHHIELMTGYFANNAANSDIRTLFEKRFALVAAGYPSLGPTWPGPRTIARLTDLAAGLFIWAETVMKFTEQGIPDEQLDLILTGKFRDEGNDIDSLYQRILDVSFKDSKHSLLDTFKDLIGFIILAKTPLHRDDFKVLIGEHVKETSIDFILQRLSAVISVGDEDRLVHINHLSFAEFLCNTQQCPAHFVIDLNTQSAKFALVCLHILNGTSRKYTDHQEISRSFLYARRHWADHITDMTELEFYSAELWEEIKCYSPDVMVWPELHAFYAALTASSETAEEVVVSSRGAIDSCTRFLQETDSLADPRKVHADILQVAMEAHSSSTLSNNQFVSVKSDLYSTRKRISTAQSKISSSSLSTSQHRLLFDVQQQLMESSRCAEELFVEVSSFAGWWRMHMMDFSNLATRRLVDEKKLGYGLQKNVQLIALYLSRIVPAAHRYCRTLSTAGWVTMETELARDALIEAWHELYMQKIALTRQQFQSSPSITH